MRCTACGYESPSGKKFCGECGAALKLKCPSCGGENTPGTKFCGDCGKPLIDTEKPPAPLPDPRSYTPKHLAEKILTSRSALEGERKQVTVLFADIQGSMELATQLDPERWHGLLERYFAVLTDAVSVRGHGQPVHGRRHHGVVRGADRPRRPRATGVLRGAQGARRLTGFHRRAARDRGAQLFGWPSHRRCEKPSNDSTPPRKGRQSEDRTRLPASAP
jgi:Double zinc ribbon